MSAERHTIVVIDDKERDAEITSLVLRDKIKNATVCLVRSSVKFAEVLAKGHFDLVITEQSMQWASGPDILDTVKRLYPQCPVIFLTSFADPNIAFDAAKRGLDEYISRDSAGLVLLPDSVQRLLPDRPKTSSENREHDSTIDKLPVGIFRLSEDGRIDCCNPACCELLGLGPMNREKASHLSDIFADGPNFDRLKEALSSAHQSLIDVDVQLKDADNRWVRISLWPSDNRESLTAREGSVVDITSYQNALDRLAIKTEELSRSNSDLEKFAYVASHDLQEPLSYISRYADLFQERYSTQLDGNAEQYLSHINESAHRLQLMVDDILALSRVSTHSEPFTAVDFGEAADAAAASLEGTFQEANAVLDRGALPTLSADKQQIQRLFQNLFSNAVKFRGKDRPQIRVDARREEDCWLFSVRDNGIGIEAEGIKRIFGMFQRLHSSKEYAGTGIGLAICQSIVNRHGGKIWAESEPGNGATFFFTICSNLESGAQSIPVG